MPDAGGATWWTDVLGGITPYYADDSVVIIHADCREVLPTLAPGSVDLVLTDPPYGVAHFSGRSSYMYGEMALYRNPIEGDDDTALRDWVLMWWGDKPAIVFGTWKVPKPPNIRAVLIWDKGEASGMGDLTIPWEPTWEEIYIMGRGFLGHRSGAVLRAYVPPRVSMGRVHPTEKPVALIRTLLQKAPAGVVLDPFMGSGTTLRAAKDLGRKCIGIEIEERYCAIAAQRMAQGILL